MVTICLHTGHFEITKSEQVAKKKALQTHPKLCCTITHFRLVPPAPTLLTFTISFLNSNLHLSLQTVKYLFPVGDFYLLLKDVFMLDNTRINATMKQYSVTLLLFF